MVEPGDAGEETAACLDRAVLLTLKSEGVTDAELSLTLLGDEEIRELNRTHLSLDRPTDVIAFALFDEGEPVVGDIYLGLDQARLHASREGITIVEELVRLAIHGTLHVLGWTHPEREDAREDSAMYRRQETLVSDAQGNTD